MPYINQVNNLNQTCQFNMNHKQLYKDVKAAMKKTGDERKAMLKAAFMKNYAIDGKGYVRSNETLKIDEFSSLTVKDNAAEKKLNYGQYIIAYSNIVRSMAKDLDPQYNPPFMIGLTEKEVGTMIDNQVASFTVRDSRVYEIKKHFDKASLLGEIVSNTCPYDSKNGRHLEEAPFDYNTAQPDRQGKIRKIHTMKECVRGELQSKGFFWKLFHPKKTREMREVITAAENALARANFPDTAIEQAVADAAQKAVHLNEVNVAKSVVEYAFVPAEIKEREKFFDPSYAPEMDLNENINYRENYELMMQTYEDYVKDNPDLPEEARAVFMEKMSVVSEVYNMVTELTNNSAITNDQKVAVFNQKKDEIDKRTEAFSKEHQFYTSPNIKSLEDRKEIAQFFKVDFRPKRENLQPLLAIASDLGKRFKNDETFLTGDAKRLLGLNIRKVSMMKKLVNDDVHNDDKLDDEKLTAAYEEIEAKFKKEYSNYKMPSLKNMPKPAASEKKSTQATNNKLQNAKSEDTKVISQSEGPKQSSKDNIIMEGLESANLKKDENIRVNIDIPELQDSHIAKGNLSPKINESAISKEPMIKQNPN